MQRTPALLMRHVGTALTELPPGFQAIVVVATKSIEKEYPKATDANIQGSNPHQSSTDKKDTKDVVTVSFHTTAGTRILSIHAHEDGTWNVFPSRNAYKGKE